MRLRADASSGHRVGVGWVCGGVYALFDVVVDASKMVESGSVQRVCEGLLGETPGVMDGAEVGPVARSASQDSPVGGEELLGGFDDVEQADLFRGSGKDVTTVRSGARLAVSALQPERWRPSDGRARLRHGLFQDQQPGALQT